MSPPKNLLSSTVSCSRLLKTASPRLAYRIQNAILSNGMQLVAQSCERTNIIANLLPLCKPRDGRHTWRRHAHWLVIRVRIFSPLLSTIAINVLVFLFLFAPADGTTPQSNKQWRTATQHVVVLRALGCVLWFGWAPLLRLRLARLLLRIFLCCFGLSATTAPCSRSTTRIYAC